MRLVRFLCIAWISLGGHAGAQTTDATEPLQVSDCYLINPIENPNELVAACNVLLKTEQPATERAIALSNRGIALRVLEEFDESLSDFKASLELFPDTSTQRMLAWTYREMGDPTKAEALFSEVLKTDDNWQGWLSRCIARQDLQNYADAAPDCQAALDRDPDNTEALYFAARAYNYLANGKAALPLIRKAIAADPKDPRYESELIWAWYFNGQSRRALARAQVILSKNPDNAAVLEFMETVKP